MIFVNKSPFVGTLPYRVYEWGRNKLELGGLIQSVKVYGYSHHAFRGSANRYKRSVIVRVNPTRKWYPYTDKYRQDAPPIRLADCYDALVYVMLHELAHFADWRNRDELDDLNPPRRGMESRVENIAVPLLREFQENRELIFDVWRIQPDPKLLALVPA